MAWACDQLKTTTGRNLGISSNNSQGRLFEGGDYFKYCSLEVVPEIFCSIFPLNQNNKYIDKYTEHVPNLIQFIELMSMSSASAVESSLISFAGWDSTLALSAKFTAMEA